MAIDAKHYAWLDSVGTLPRMVVEARKLIGVKEAPGNLDNPVILGWAKTLGDDIARVMVADRIPWCGLFMAYVAKAAGKTPPPKPYWALNWGTFGIDSGQPELGDVLTFMRKAPDGKPAGHVALYIGQDDECYHVLGGNQGDQVCFARYDKDRVKAARKPLYMQEPASVRPYLLSAVGAKAPADD